MPETPILYGNDLIYERTIGERLKAYRLDRNISQQDLAEKAGVARRTITSVESGKGCTLNTLIRLLRALGKLDLIYPLVEELPLSPRKIHEANLAKERPRKYASKPRNKAPAPGRWVWDDER